MFIQCFAGMSCTEGNMVDWWAHRLQVWSRNRREPWSCAVAYPDWWNLPSRDATPGWGPYVAQSGFLNTASIAFICSATGTLSVLERHTRQQGEWAAWMRFATDTIVSKLKDKYNVSGDRGRKIRQRVAQSTRRKGGRRDGKHDIISSFILEMAVFAGHYRGGVAGRPCGIAAGMHVPR